MSKITKLTIRIEGGWNTKIFQPDWLIQNVLEGQDVKNRELNILLNLEKKEFGFKFNEIEILPNENYLEIVIEGQNADKNEIIENATRIALKIIKLLPHTPISSINFNVFYSFETEKNNFIKLFKENIQVIKNYRLNEYKLTSLNDIYRSNIIITLLSDNKINAEFNFIYDKIIDFEENVFLNHIIETKGLI